MKLNPLPYLLALPGTHRETLLEVQQLKSEVTLLEQILTSERADFSQSLEAAKQEASRKGIPFQEVEQDLKRSRTTRAGILGEPIIVSAADITDERIVSSRIKIEGHQDHFGITWYGKDGQFYRSKAFYPNGCLWIHEEKLKRQDREAINFLMTHFKNGSLNRFTFDLFTRISLDFEKRAQTKRIVFEPVSGWEVFIDGQARRLNVSDMLDLKLMREVLTAQAA